MLQTKIVSLVQDQQKWIEDYFFPVVARARQNTPPKWFQTATSAFSAIGLGIGLCVAAAATHYAVLAIPAIAFALTGVFLPSQYRREFEARRIIQGINTNSTLKEAQFDRLIISKTLINARAAWEEGSPLVSTAGRAIGPVGFAAGLVLLGIVGWLNRNKLDEQKEKLYEGVIGELDRILSIMIDGVDRQLQQTEQLLIREVTAAFEQNLHIVEELLNR